MKKPIAILTLSISILCLPGCFRDATVTGLPVSDQAEIEEWRHHFLYGLVRGVKDVDMNEVCPQGVGRIERKQNGWNGLVSVLTIGIYTPQKLNLYCAATPVTVERIVAEPPNVGAESTQEQVAE